MPIINPGMLMGLLNIGKKEEEAPAEKQDVPDELPDLPASAPADSTGAAQAAPGTVPDELPPAGDLAPDELPPVSPGMQPQSNPAQFSDPGQLGDRRLFFSEMLQKLQEEGIKSTKLTNTSANLLSDMKRHWRKERKVEEIQTMQQELADKMTPLAKLEQEWVALKDDIDQKKQLLQEKEHEIKRMAEDLKSLAVKTETLKSKQV